MPVNVNVPVDGFLDRCNENLIRYTCFPARKKGILKFHIEQLDRRKTAIKNRVEELEATQDVERREEVSNWLRSVDSVSRRAHGLLDNLSHRRGLFSCCYLWSNYRHGKQVDESLEMIQTLDKEREGWGDDNKLTKNKLAEENAWDLFCRSISGGRVDVNDPTFIHQAKRILLQCQRFPLAVTAVARAVRNYQQSDEWELAIRRLTYPPQSHQPVPGKLTVESILRFCYDSLDDDQLRSCLLYCALFPKNYNICESELILDWIGEGFFDCEDGSPEFFSAYGKGLDIIRKLKDASLIDYSRELCDFYLRLPTDVWHMAQQITDGDGNPYLIYTEDPGETTQGARSWASATRVSVINLDTSLPGPNIIFHSSSDGIPSSDIASLPDDTSCCRKLKTLLAGGNKRLGSIPQDFFRFVPALRVLDLSSTNIKEIPRTIKLLTQLQYLKLTNTNITKLPIELGELRNLRMLHLNDTRKLKELPAESITGLSALQSLMMGDNAYWWDLPQIVDDSERSMQHSGPVLLKLDDLGSLSQMQALWLTIRSIPTLELLLMNFTDAKGLTLKGSEVSEHYVKEIFARLTHLRWLQLHKCTKVENLKVGRTELRFLQELKLTSLEKMTTISSSDGSILFPWLRHLGIGHCHAFKDLSWVGQLPVLELLCLQNCRQVEQLIARNEEEPFPRLQFLVLDNLPQVTSFSWKHPLRLSSLRGLRISRCPKLKKLPLGYQSGKNITEIRGSQEWWNELQWDDNNIKLTFHPHFHDM